MSYFLSSEMLEQGQLGRLIEEEAHHALHTRRLQSGDQFEVQDPKGNRFLVEFQGAHKRWVEFMTLEPLNPPQESPLKLTIMQAIIKEKSLDFLIQKTTELGVAQLCFFNGIRTPRVLGTPQRTSLQERWEKIAWEACKQSGRLQPPSILSFPSLIHCLDHFSIIPAQWILSTTPPVQEPNPSQNKNFQSMDQRVLVGPEGGWHPDEELLAQQKEWHSFSLGPRILRAETAAITAASILQWTAGDLGQ